MNTMNTPTPRALGALHASVLVVWLGTALVSALDYGGWLGSAQVGPQLLKDAGIHSAPLQTALIWSGLLADLVVGLWLWIRPGRSAYAAALTLMTAMTLAGTALHPALWMHPLGPLLKNLPIAAALWVLWQAQPALHSTPKVRS